jgi:hypothetical protein
MVPAYRHAGVAALAEFSGIFLPPSFPQDLREKYWVLASLLLVADVLPVMPITK